MLTDIAAVVDSYWLLTAVVIVSVFLGACGGWVACALCHASKVTYQDDRHFDPEDN